MKQTARAVELPDESFRKIQIDQVTEASKRLKDYIRETPLIQTEVPGNPDVYMKCENLQKTGSFKYRGAMNALLKRREDLELWQMIRECGVATASSGNLGVAMAQATSELQIPFTVLVREDIVSVKLESIYRRNPNTIVTKLPITEWMAVMKGKSAAQWTNGFFISGETDPSFLEGLGTISLEIFSNKKDWDSIVTPYGGGALSLASTTVARQFNSEVNLVVAECTAGAPFNVCSREGMQARVSWVPSFVDGIGASFVIPELFQEVMKFEPFSKTANLTTIRDTIRNLATFDNIIVEGAGACSVAVAQEHAKNNAGKPVVAIISGGNFNYEDLPQGNLEPVRKGESNDS